MEGEMINSEQLNKINKWVIELRVTEEILSEAHSYGYVPILLRNKNSQNKDFPCVTIETELIEPILITHRDKLKAELKELGFEE
jgi:hypothetical protein